MKAHTIRLRPDRPNDPLATCNVGRLSSAVFVICGEIPDDIDTLAVQVSRTLDPDTQQPRPLLSAAANETTPAGMPSRVFRCYLAPFYFPDVSPDLVYHIVGTDTKSNPRWLGSGSLIVRNSPADGSAIVPEIIPADTYIRNPLTGLYHKLTAQLNELGEVTVTVEEEGIER